MKRDPRLTKLSWDHHHGLVLAREIEHVVPGADDARLLEVYAAVLAEWTRSVLPHFHAEEGCLLARLLRYREGVALAAKTGEDHLTIEGLIADLRDAGSAEERRTALLAFAGRLREHIRWEERVMFEEAQGLLSSVELDAVGTEVDPLLAEPQAFSLSS